jgi:hypothetical protein
MAGSSPARTAEAPEASWKQPTNSYRYKTQIRSPQCGDGAYQVGLG